MDTFEPPLYFGDWLKARRKALDLTQTELALRAGCSTPGLRKIETGERRPSKELAVLLARALEIDAERQVLFVRVARGELSVNRLGSPAPGQASIPAPNRQDALPTAPTPFIGRSDELIALTELLRERACRVLTLIGPGGIGKTRLSIEVAEHAARQFADGACFVPLAMVSSANFLVPAIADALGFSFQGQTEARAQLLSFMRGRQLLLVLDNMEHLLDGVELISEIIARAPGVKLIVTSRERLNMHGEWVYEIAGLPVPRDNDLASAESYSAVALFLQSIRRVRAGYELQETDLQCIVHICRTLEGTPLGIELAAAWTFALSPCQIADQIDDNLDFLQTTMRGVPERQRSLRAAFDHSWNLLSSEERCVLSQLAVFHGGFEPHAAEQVAGASLASLLALASKSLVRRRESGRFDLHEVVRQYALSHLSASTNYDATMDRHSDFYLLLLANRERDLKGPAQGEAVRELTLEIGNIRSAWAWAVEHGRFNAIGRALRSYGYMCEVGGRLREGIDEIDLIVQALDGQEHTAEVQSILSNAYAQLGLLNFRLGEFDQAMKLITDSLALARAQNDPYLMVQPLVLGGIMRHLMGEYEKSLELMREGGHCARVIHAEWFEIYAHYNIGYVASLYGNYASGYELMKHSLEAWRVNSDPRSVALGLNYISPTLIRLGRYQEARTCLEESIALCVEAGDRWGLGTAYRHMGVLALAQGQVDEARMILNRSLETFSGYVTGWDVYQSLVSLGDCEVAGGNRQEAARFYKAALRGAMAEYIIPQVLAALVGIAELRWRERCVQDALVISLSVLDQPSSTHSTLERARRIKQLAMSRLTSLQAAEIESDFPDRSLPVIGNWILTEVYNRPSIDPA